MNKPLLFNLSVLAAVLAAILATGYGTARFLGPPATPIAMVTTDAPSSTTTTLTQTTTTTEPRMDVADGRTPIGPYQQEVNLDSYRFALPEQWTISIEGAASDHPWARISTASAAFDLIVLAASDIHAGIPRSHLDAIDGTDPDQVGTVTLATDEATGRRLGALTVAPAGPDGTYHWSMLIATRQNRWLYATSTTPALLSDVHGIVTVFTNNLDAAYRQQP